MKKILFLLIGILAISCSKDEFSDIENTSIILVTPFLEYKPDYSNYYPSFVKAYFIAKENAGIYKSGQLVTVVNLTGGKTLVKDIPSIKYDVYISNFMGDKWYVSGLDGLPVNSDIMYIYGYNEINAKTEVTTEVFLQNPYSYIIISGDIIKEPYEITNRATYNYTGCSWVKFIRGKQDTRVPLKGGEVVIKKDVIPNEIYTYKVTD